MIYAEDVNYFKTGTSAPDTWIDKAKAEIRTAGGKTLSEAYGKDGIALGRFPRTNVPVSFAGRGGLHVASYISVARHT